MKKDDDLSVRFPTFRHGLYRAPLKCWLLMWAHVLDHPMDKKTNVITRSPPSLSFFSFFYLFCPTVYYLSINYP